MRMNTRTAICLTILSLLAVALSAAAPEDQIRNAEKQWAAGVVARNFSALERLLDDTLIYAHSTGVIETKKEYLGKLRAGTQKYAGIDQESLTIRMYGDSAVAHSKVRMHGSNAQGPFDNRLMMLHLWVKTGGQWRLVAHQTTKL